MSHDTEPAEIKDYNAYVKKAYMYVYSRSIGCMGIQAYYTSYHDALQT